MFGSTNTGLTGIQFQNTSVTFSLQSTPDFADYPYRGQFANSGITAQAYAEVVYSSTQASSGNYAPFCKTENGYVYLYARANVGTQTIPTIAIGTASFSLTIDNNVTQGSQNPVSSGGVYNNFGIPFDVMSTTGTATINKCKVNGETWYVALCNGYLIFGGADPHQAGSFYRIGSDTTHYFQSNICYNDQSDYTKYSGIIIPVRKGQYFFASGAEHTHYAYNQGLNGMTGWRMGDTYTYLSISHGCWFIPADTDDIFISAYIREV